MIEIPVSFRDGSGVQAIEVRGEPDESFLISLKRVLPAGSGGGSPQVVVRGTKGNAQYFVIDDRPTMRLVREFAAGEVLDIDCAPRGGGSFDLFFELIAFGLNVFGVLDVVERGRDGFAARRYKSQRRAAKQWLDDGAPSELPYELLLLVKAQNPWKREEFDQAFDLTAESAPRLLKLGGYRKAGFSPEVWVDESESQDF